MGVKISIYATIGALILSGCMTTGGMRTINSTPSAALVQIDGYGSCETPCTVRLDGRRRITVAKAGYKAQRFYITPDGAAVNVILELAAPTEGVSSESLPEL